jgi:hypothetical protein
MPHTAHQWVLLAALFASIGIVAWIAIFIT